MQGNSIQIQIDIKPAPEVVVDTIKCNVQHHAHCGPLTSHYWQVRLPLPAETDSKLAVPTAAALATANTAQLLTQRLILNHDP